MPRPQPEPARIVERLDRRQDPVEVEQRLAHAHEDDVREVASLGRQPALRVARLVDDLGDLEVSPEPELPRRTERAADRTAGLAGDAQRVPFARAAPRRIVHQHRFDEGAVGEAVERLLGGSVVRQPDLGFGDRVEHEVPGEGVTERRRQGADRGCVRHPAIGPHGVRDLARSVGRLALHGHPRGQRVGREAGDPGKAGAGGHDLAMLAPMIDGRPRTNASQVMRRPPAGWTSRNRRRPP